LPANEITFNSIAAKAGTSVSILGYNKPLQWTAGENGVKITVPKDLANALDKNINIWTVKIENADDNQEKHCVGKGSEKVKEICLFLSFIQKKLEKFFFNQLFYYMSVCIINF
jgi:hypothetical protein